MRTLFGAVAGALAVGAVLVSYDLGERRAFSRDLMTPTTQMVMGPDGVARPYLMQAGQTTFGQPFAGQPYGGPPTRRWLRVRSRRMVTVGIRNIRQRSRSM
jgi:hypothetical protein